MNIIYNLVHIIIYCICGYIIYALYNLGTMSGTEAIILTIILILLRLLIWYDENKYN